MAKPNVSNRRRVRRRVKKKDNVHKKDNIQKKNINMFDNLPWVEKYRPSSFNDVKLNPSIRRTIKSMITKGDFKNIILEGPPGVGKTTTVKCVAHELYGKYYDQMVMEINASDDRGIKIKDVIEKFIRLYAEIDEEDKDKIPTFRLIIMDEADNMTDKAKHNITNFLEGSNNKVRFAFTCNTKNNISPAIQSRCYTINYPLLNDDFIKSRLMHVCEIEGIYTSAPRTDNKKINIKKNRTNVNKGLDAIMHISNGDLRKAINILQLTFDRYNTISMDMVYSMYDKPHPDESISIIEACVDVDFKKALSIVLNMIKRGYSVADMTGGLINVIKRESLCGHIPISYRIELIPAIGYAQYNVSQGLELSKLQAGGCIADMCRIMKEIKDNE